jgi:exoribonuclease R
MYKYVVSHNTSGFINANTNEPAEIDEKIDTSKLFHNDLFVINESNQIVLTETPTRLSVIPAILCLRNNRTYGRIGDKHLYKCIPNDKHLPPFLVAYEMKNVGFSKVFSNKYVLIRFLKWTELNPHANLTNAIGDVDILENYYEYQLHCTKLALTMQYFNKGVATALISTNPTFIPTESRAGMKIITIDPAGTRDFDDALSIVERTNGTTTVSVYIANVVACLDAYNLWEYVSKVSTIYLPDKSRPMLPHRLSEHECSLVCGLRRIALTMDVALCTNTGTVLDVSFKNTAITVSHNYVYEETALLASREYRQLFEITNKMQTGTTTGVATDSHELVAFWMGQMNRRIAEKMHDEHRTGIFRRATLLNNDILPTAIKNWKNSVCEYVAFGGDVRHGVLEVDKYIHITSPIRRLVDLLNMTKFQLCLGVPLSISASAFYNKWIDKLDYINDQMRSVRRVQTQCSLLAMCSTSIEPIECDAYLFDKQTINEPNKTLMFSVYLKSLNLIYKIKIMGTEEVANGDIRRVRIIVFNDEDSLKKKVRLQLLK